MRKFYDQAPARTGGIPTAPAKHLNLSVLPPEFRAVFEAQAARVAQLEEINKSQEHLIAEKQRALYGKKSEKLADDDRQLAFEDLEVAFGRGRRAEIGAG